jgi:hypothetical protein
MKILLCFVSVLFLVGCTACPNYNINDSNIITQVVQTTPRYETQWDNNIYYTPQPVIAPTVPVTPVIPPTVPIPPVVVPIMPPVVPPVVNNYRNGWYDGNWGYW